MSFSFGAPSSAPATSGLSSGFSFGANKPATPGFGLAATSQPSTSLFGTPASSAPAFGSTSFGGTATPAFGATSAAPSFGATTTPAFGASTAAPAFGSTTTTPAFGATQAPAFGASGTTFGAGTGLGTGVNFGTGSNTAASTGGLSFGTPAATTTSTGLGGLGGFGFGAATTTQSGFGLFASTSTATTTNSLFGDAMFPHQNNPQSSPFIPITQTFRMLPSSPHTNTMIKPSFDLSPIPMEKCEKICGYETRSAKRDRYHTLSPSFGKLGTTNVIGTQPSTSVTPSLGLGGVSTAAGGIGASNTTGGDGKNEPPKQTKLPNEISTTVDTFKEFVKKQKSLSSDVMRHSVKPLQKVSAEVETTLRQTLSLSGEVHRARAHSRRLRAAAAAALAAAESVARDPPGSELEGSAPPAYVKELVSELEQQLITFRRQMDEADKQMQSSPKLLTEQEMTLGIRRMYESLVALAGRLQAAHAQVDAQKAQYLNLRKYVLKDPTDVFEGATKTSTSLDQILRESEGARKKNRSSFYDSTLGSAVLSDPRAALGSIHQLAGPTPFSYIGNTLSPFPASDPSGPSWQPQQQTSLNTSLGMSGFGASASADAGGAFNLQKPPGKRTKQ